jgi:hypothetical protein
MQAEGAIMVKLVEQPAHEVTVADVILGSLGIAGLMTLAAVVLGVAVGLVLIRRSRNRGLEHEHPPSIQVL